MSYLIVPKDYKPIIEARKNQIAIKEIKDYFQHELAIFLALRRTTAPLFVTPESGLNDNLNGVERTVDFTLKDMDERPVEVVQSLAKWKRMALAKYGIERSRRVCVTRGAFSPARGSHRSPPPGEGSSGHPYAD